MTTKFISLITGLVSLAVYLQSQLSSNDPLFSLTSNNFIVNLLMLLLAVAAIAVSFQTRFKSWYSYAACTSAAVVLCIAGIAGIFFPNFLYFFWDILLPLNYMIMLECGVIFGLSSLTYKHAARPQRLSLPEPSSITTKFQAVFPDSKIPHSPQTSRTRRAQPA